MCGEKAVWKTLHLNDRIFYSGFTQWHLNYHLKFINSCLKTSSIDTFSGIFTHRTYFAMLYVIILLMISLSLGRVRNIVQITTILWIVWIKTLTKTKWTRRPKCPIIHRVIFILCPLQAFAVNLQFLNLLRGPRGVNQLDPR